MCRLHKHGRNFGSFSLVLLGTKSRKSNADCVLYSIQAPAVQVNSRMDSIASFDVKSLRKVQTRVRTSDGRRYVETRDDAGEPRATSSPRFDGHPGYVVDLQPDLQIGQVLPGLYIG